MSSSCLTVDGSGCQIAVINNVIGCVVAEMRGMYLPRLGYRDLCADARGFGPYRGSCFHVVLFQEEMPFDIGLVLLYD